MAYKPAVSGQITMIRLENFMSYDNIELRPGFHLNLIIGPNGTGKSTFVCAVMLGLGGKLKSLGRAERLNAYIKNGCHESKIEIDLYDAEYGSVLITRKIYSDNHSEFYINGKSVSASEVNDIRLKYNIQIENLCTFLPQEKVQDFSKLNPQQLLDQTQKTVGSNDLISNYEKLKSLQKIVKDKEKENDYLKEQIENVKEKNVRLKEKVESFLQKQALYDKLNTLNQKKSWLSYHNEILKIRDITNDLKVCEEQFSNKRKVYGKHLEVLKKLEENLTNVQENFSKTKNDSMVKKKALEEAQKELRDRVERLDVFDSIIETKLKEEENKKVELKQYQETLDKLKNDLHTFQCKNGTDEQLKAVVDEINEELNKCNEEESRLRGKKTAIEDSLENLKNEIRNVSAESRLLEKKKNYRMEYIKRFEPDLYKSIEWLEENRHIFQSRIFNPMLLELDVTNAKMAKYVEARITYRDLISFTCTNPDDLNLLIQKLRTEQKLRINAVCSDDDDVSHYLPDVPLNQIKSLGFVSYMKDLITGPGHIVHYLCKVYRIHCIPIGDETVKQKCDKVPISIPVFFSENNMFTIKVSVYSGDKAINVKQLNEPKFFSMSLEREKVQHLQERERDLKLEIEKKTVKLNILMDDLRSVTKKMEDMRQKKRNMATLNEEKKQILFKVKRVENNIKFVQETIKDESKIVDEAEKDRMDLKKEIHKNLHSLVEFHKKLNKSWSKKQENDILFKTYRLKIDRMLEIKTNLLEDINKLQVTLNKVKAVKEEKEVNCKQLKEAAKKLTNGISPGEKGFSEFERKFKTLKNTIEELEAEIQETQVMIDFLHGGDAQVVQEYQKREEYIAKLMVSLNQSQTTLDESKRELERLRESWVVPIKELITKINFNFGSFFELMGCVGEVCLTTGESQDDFDQYGIVIRVKFRNEMPLQNLGRFFQSGGERAVATAVYLLSLQELISVPFRFVDEINQGMDVVNERRIISLMVNTTSGESSTQYFFITPKLLPDIDCSETMVVHCICSGNTSISSKNWDLKQFLLKKKNVANVNKN